MPVVCYRLFVALWRELFGSLGDHCNIHLARLRRGSGTQPCMECGKGVTKNDSGYVWTAVTIKLGCVPGKGIIELLWSS